MTMTTGATTESTTGSTTGRATSVGARRPCRGGCQVRRPRRLQDRLRQVGDGARRRGRADGLVDDRSHRFDDGMGEARGGVEDRRGRIDDGLGEALRGLLRRGGRARRRHRRSRQRAERSPRRVRPRGSRQRVRRRSRRARRRYRLWRPRSRRQGRRQLRWPVRSLTPPSRRPTSRCRRRGRWHRLLRPLPRRCRSERRWSDSARRPRTQWIRRPARSPGRGCRTAWTRRRRTPAATTRRQTAPRRESCSSPEPASSIPTRETSPARTRWPPRPSSRSLSCRRPRCRRPPTSSDPNRRSPPTRRPLVVLGLLVVGRVVLALGLVLLEESSRRVVRRLIGVVGRVVACGVVLIGLVGLLARRLVRPAVVPVRRVLPATAATRSPTAPPRARSRRGRQHRGTKNEAAREHGEHQGPAGQESGPRRSVDARHLLGRSVPGRVADCRWSRVNHSDEIRKLLRTVAGRRREAGVGPRRDELRDGQGSFQAEDEDEPDPLPGPHLGRAVDVGVAHRRDDRVAARHRMVGEEHHRLPARRHLDRAAHHPLAGHLGVVGPPQPPALQPHADPVAAARRGPGDPGQLRRFGDELGARAEDGAQHDRVARRRAHRGDVDERQRGGLRPDG